MAASIDIDDNSALVLEAIRAAIEDSLDEIGSTVAERARSTVPVDTGALRDSIGHKVSGSTAYVYAQQPYASYVELGTSRQAPQPYLRPAATEDVSVYERIMREKFSRI